MGRSRRWGCVPYAGCPRECEIARPRVRARGEVRGGPQASNMLAISLELIGSSTNPNVPCSRISRAARRNAASATRDNAPPTLTRLTPIVEVGAAMEEILRARREREWKREAACRLHRRVDSLDRMFECIDRIVVAIGAVFDGAAGEPGGGRHPDGVGDGLRIISKSVLEV